MCKDETAKTGEFRLQRKAKLLGWLKEASPFTLNELPRWLSFWLTNPRTPNNTHKTKHA